MEFFSQLIMVSGLLHEFFHALMALLMYPFGTRILGIKIIAGVNGENSIFQGSVYTSEKYLIPLFLVSAAPLIFYIIIQVILIFFVKSILIALPFFMLIDCAFLSSADIRNIKGAIGMSPVFYNGSGEALAKNLNECLDNRIEEIKTP